MCSWSFQLEYAHNYWNSECTKSSSLSVLFKFSQLPHCHLLICQLLPIWCTCALVTAFQLSVFPCRNCSTHSYIVIWAPLQTCLMKGTNCLARSWTIIYFAKIASVVKCLMFGNQSSLRRSWCRDPLHALVQPQLENRYMYMWACINLWKSRLE